MALLGSASVHGALLEMKLLSPPLPGISEDAPALGGPGFSFGWVVLCSSGGRWPLIGFQVGLGI